MENTKGFRSIKSKLIYLLGFSAMMGIILSSIATFTHTANSQKTQDLKVLSQLTEIINLNLLAAVEFDDDLSAKAILHSLEQDNSIQASYITKTGVIFSSHMKHDIEKAYLQVLEAIYKEKVSNEPFDYIDFDHMVVNRPIISDGEMIGSFMVIADTQRLKDALLEQLFVQLMAAILALIVIVLLAFKLQKMFTAPIFTLSRAINYIASSNRYDIQVETESNDEFKSLFKGFNTMVDVTNEQREKLKEIHKHTRDSIEYASLIQGALIPESRQFQECFDGHFSIWHPKDIVGGDIYFFEEFKNKEDYLLMMIDCTGHGVPGAFVTMLVKAIERQIVGRIRNTGEDISPAKILSIFNSSMKHILKQDDDSSISNAGFDGAILYYNKVEKTIKFAGAETPLLYMDEDVLHTIKGSRHSIGYKKSDANYQFKEHIINVKPGMQFYLTTDGYIDQNGGEKGFGFGKTRFKELIIKNYQESMADQQELLLLALADYQGEAERNDDITVIGFRI
ncbi:MAG: hypothetical protein COA90_02160 [Gammaproteobacteria bacterium]|nr:MAG: hypothetical protein COA90_02160 [Gammaproteobacteria bacterium]